MYVRSVMRNSSYDLLDICQNENADSRRSFFFVFPLSLALLTLAGCGCGAGLGLGAETV